MVLSMSSRRKLIPTAATTTTKPGRKFTTVTASSLPANGKSKFVAGVNKSATNGSGGNSSSSSTSSSYSASLNKDKKLSDITHSSSSKANKLNHKPAPAVVTEALPSTSNAKSAKMLKTTQQTAKQQSNGPRQELTDSSIESTGYRHEASAESLKNQEEVYDARIGELKAQLEALKKLDILPALTSPSTELLDNLTKMASSYESKCGLCNYVEHYVQESARLEKESKENLLVLRAWYERQREQLQQQFETEQAKARQEFADRQKELKENLQNEYEEMRRQLESDKTQLDINLDVADVKPAPTRKLRRRMNANNDDMSDLVGSSYPQLSSVASAASVMLQSASGPISQPGSAPGGSVSLNVTAGLGLNNQYSNTSLTASYYSGQSSYFSSLTMACSILNSSMSNERKRKNPSAITFNLNDDEILEDAKFLQRNLHNYNFS